jgi:hypothetical protein
MTTALRRRVQALRRLAERPGTTGEGIAAELAIERILRRLGDDAEKLTEREPPYVTPKQKRTGRRRERPHAEGIHMGDILDCTDYEGTFRRCACSSSSFQVGPCIDGLAVAPAYSAGWRLIGFSKRDASQT